jgi:hypothetical protein
VVTRASGQLIPGHILVSNFNNKKNRQGTGTNIIDIAPDGAAAVLSAIDGSKVPGQCPAGGDSRRPW